MPQTWKENQEGLNEAYYSHCSFRSPTQPVPAEINPRNVLNRLFNKKEQQLPGGAANQMSSLDQRMLDLVLNGARQLRRTLPATDQRKLDKHHSQTHHNNEPEMVRKVAAITAFNIEQFAYMVKKLHSLREGDGTLLDNCILMWGSGLEDGNKHTRENLPFILREVGMR